jgi:cytosine/adenosine deaminase-related metal-dependent hydrolase
MTERPVIQGCWIAPMNSDDQRRSLPRGREDELGSLEPGMLADVAMWRIDDLEHAVVEDPVAGFVLGEPRPVERLLVAGRRVVDGGELQTDDEPRSVQMWRALAGGWRRE